MLVPHLFSKRECHVAKRCGKYCVEFVPFKKEKRSMEILQHWTNQCLEWCYDLNEDDRFGDQKYLEEWEKWDDVYISQDHGLGVEICTYIAFVMSKDMVNYAGSTSPTILHGRTISFRHKHPWVLLFYVSY